MSLVILTKPLKINFFSKENYYNTIKQIIGRKRGPDAVSSSLLRGLKGINYNFKINPNIKDITLQDVIFINNSVSALKWAVQQKKNGKIGRLIAGPNLVITPDDFGGIINSSEIDLILQPSEWVKDFYLSINPKLENRIKIWPAGVIVPENVKKSIDNRVLIYFKNCFDNKLLSSISSELEKLNIKFDILYYGNFNQKKYFNMLEKAKFMIYISNSESQGIALQEAWARDVPTLVWANTNYNYKGYKWNDNKISAPYLTPESGMFFSDFNDFIEKVKIFLNETNKFSARNYVKNNLSNKKSAEKFLELIK